MNQPIGSSKAWEHRRARTSERVGKAGWILDGLCETGSLQTGYTLPGGNDLAVA